MWCELRLNCGYSLKLEKQNFFFLFNGLDVVYERKITSNYKVFWFGRMKFPFVNTGKTVMAVHWCKLVVDMSSLKRQLHIQMKMSGRKLGT